MAGRLDGSVDGVPLTIETDGQTIRLQVARLFGAIGPLRSAAKITKPIRSKLPSAGLNVRLKLGPLPEFTVA